MLRATKPNFALGSSLSLLCQWSLSKTNFSYNIKAVLSAFSFMISISPELLVNKYNEKYLHVALVESLQNKGSRVKFAILVCPDCLN